MTSRFASTFVLFILSVFLLPHPVQAGEILTESGSARVVSGDTTAWLTRGITTTPEPSVLSAEMLAQILDSVSVELAGTSLTAIIEGVRRFGWAQRETEPVGVSERVKVRIHATAESLTVVNMDIYDRVAAKAVMDIKTGTIRSERFELNPGAGSTVYAGLASPEFWIIQQEHLQKQFFESIIDLDHPELKSVQDAYDNGKISLALYEVAEFYRRKAKHTGMSQRPAQAPTSRTHSAAEKIVNHTFNKCNVTVQMGKRIDWQTHPREAHGAEWIWQFNRHFHLLTLLSGYTATANETYAQEYVDQICDFIIRNPAPPYTLTRVAAWRNLDVGIRAISWPRSFYGFLSSANFTPQAIQLVLTGMWSHGDYIREHPAGLRRPSNWSIVDASGLTGLALYFPEFTESSAWRDSSYARLTHQLHLQVYSDGAQYELAPGYHQMCLGRFQSAMDLTEKTGNRLPEEFGRIVESMYDYLMWLVKPDGNQPAVSDSRPSWSLRGTLLQGARRFGRDDMLYVGSGGKEGAPPDSTSHLLPDAGYAIMRSGWDPDARYLLFDGGPVGSGHQHEDKLAILLSAFGVNFLVDTGPFEYVNNKWRRHAVSTAAHSSALVDGQGQARIETGIEHYAADTPTPHWESSSHRDYVVAQYDAGYGPDSIAVVHRRHVLFQKPDYWVVVDEFRGHGEHTVETLFQFAPDLDVSVSDGSMVVARSKKGPALTIQSSDTANAVVDIVTGQEEPRVLGWFAPHKRVPAPVAVYRTHTQLPLVQAYLLYPARKTGDDVPTMTTTRSGDSLLVEVTASGKVEQFRFALSKDR
jgi:hypothetical protein